MFMFERMREKIRWQEKEREQHIGEEKIDYYHYLKRNLLLKFFWN